MICIAVAPRSRTLAKVDLLNASRHCDLIELCLDYLIKEPDVGDLISAVDKPVLVSCRRKEDGGGFIGSEEDRIGLLRQAIVAGPAYIELDLDIAAGIPRFGETKRVISYTSMTKPLSKVEEIIARAEQVQADVVKFTWPTPTLETAWNLLITTSKKRDIPVVGVGLGEANVSLSLLGLKYGAPWMYAALEKGMEAHEGQPTVFQLDELFRWRSIDASTRFVGIVGYSADDELLVRTLNSGFDLHNMNMRCLPLNVGKIEHLSKILDALKIRALVASGSSAELFGQFASHREEGAQVAGHVDVLSHQAEGWHGYNVLWRGIVSAVEEELGHKGDSEDHPLDRKNVLVLGANSQARSAVFGMKRRQTVISVASPDDKAAQQLASAFDVRHVPFATVYDSFADVVVYADSNIPIGSKRHEISPSCLRPEMIFADVARLPHRSALCQEAEDRGCRLVSPEAIAKQMAARLFQSLTGQKLPPP